MTNDGIFWEIAALKGKLSSEIFLGPRDTAHMSTGRRNGAEKRLREIYETSDLYGARLLAGQALEIKDDETIQRGWLDDISVRVQKHPDSQERKTAELDLGLLSTHSEICGIRMRARRLLDVPEAEIIAYELFGNERANLMPEQLSLAYAHSRNPNARRAAGLRLGYSTLRIAGHELAKKLSDAVFSKSQL